MGPRMKAFQAQQPRKRRRQLRDQLRKEQRRNLKLQMLQEASDGHRLRQQVPSRRPRRPFAPWRLCERLFDRLRIAWRAWRRYPKAVLYTTPDPLEYQAMTLLAPSYIKGVVKVAADLRAARNGQPKPAEPKNETPPPRPTDTEG